MGFFTDLLEDTMKGSVKVIDDVLHESVDVVDPPIKVEDDDDDCTCHCSRDA